MKCPECGCWNELQAIVDVEQWEDEEPDNRPVLHLSASSTVSCGNCKHQGRADDFGITANREFERTD